MTCTEMAFPSIKPLRHHLFVEGRFGNWGNPDLVPQTARFLTDGHGEIPPIFHGVEVEVDFPVKSQCFGLHR